MILRSFLLFALSSRCAAAFTNGFSSNQISSHSSTSFSPLYAKVKIDEPKGNIEMDLNGQVDGKGAADDSIVNNDDKNGFAGDANEVQEELDGDEEEVDEMQLYDESNMKLAIQVAQAT